MVKPQAKIEFGDFQTPIALSQQICDCLRQLGLAPASLIEPTCGQGNLLLTAWQTFPDLQQTLGIELNLDYVNRLVQQLVTLPQSETIKIIHDDFFKRDWATMLANLPEPILIIGNPPWVTNSALGLLNGQNLPEKNNFQNHSGLEALTGKSNFDISEWMLLQLLEAMADKTATLAMLCKTSVARKVLRYAWQKSLKIAPAHLYRIDSAHYFEAAVDAGLLVIQTHPTDSHHHCNVYPTLESPTHVTSFGLRQQELISDLPHYDQWQHLAGTSEYIWRSGLKHDCAKIMELNAIDDNYTNGLGETYQLEPTFIYPLLKATGLAKSRNPLPQHFVIVTQTAINQNTDHIGQSAPKTWAYLQQHEAWFAKRKSVVYQNKSSFAMFGIGDYTFVPWKVAISGLHKQLNFAVIAPYNDKPVLFDDTCYFIGCQNQAEADYLAMLLNSRPAQEFLMARIFWDNKRPITAAILKQLSLLAVAKELGLELQFRQFQSLPAGKQLNLLI